MLRNSAKKNGKANSAEQSGNMSVLSRALKAGSIWDDKVDFFKFRINQFDLILPYLQFIINL